MRILIMFLRFAAVLFIVYLAYKFFLKGEILKFKEKQTPHSKETEDAGHKDPICGKYVNENQALKYLYNHDMNYFCSEKCKQKFLKKIEN